MSIPIPAINYEQIGFNIRDLRLEQNKTVVEVATDLGISVTDYRKIENGDVKVDVSDIVILSAYFGVPADIIVRDCTVYLVEERLRETYATASQQNSSHS